MELSSDEVDSLRRLLKEWTEQKTHELEATFQGASDMTTFMAVAQRLKAKGFRALPQEDKLNIITPEQLRFTLTGTANIQTYCNDNRLDNKSFEAMRKDRTGKESNVSLGEYGVRVKVRREQELPPTDPAVQQLMKTWSSHRKAFRLMRRYTFIEESKGVRFDLSMVRSTSRIVSRDPKTNGQFKWQRLFTDETIGQQPAEFELEVELLRPSAEDKTGKTDLQLVDLKLKQLIAGIGEVLRGMQKHHLLLRKSVTQTVLQKYAALINVPYIAGKAPRSVVLRRLVW